jgi:uncharacterized protein YndB with AHSA1/START domain
MKILKLVAAAVAAILVLSSMTLFALSRRADAGRNVAAVEVNRSPEQVFRYLTEPEKMKAWVSWLVEIRGTGQGLGAKDTWIMEDPNYNGERVSMDATVVAWDPPRAITVDISSPMGFTGKQTYKLVPIGEGRTRLETDGRFQYGPWYWQMLEPLVTPEAQKKLEGDLARLKAHAEQN